MREKKVLLALGGGGAKGYAHIGIIQALLEKGYEIEGIAGTSFGAFIGALYAYTLDIEQVKEIALQVRLFHFLDLDIWSIRKIWYSLGFCKGNRWLRFLTSIFGDAKCETLRIPFVATTIDIKKNELIETWGWRVSEAVRASTSIPLVFIPYEDRYIDGGLYRNLPVASILNFPKANEYLKIAVSVVDEDISEPQNKLGMLNWIINAPYLWLEEQALHMEQMDIIIDLDLSYSTLDFSLAEEIIEIGYREGRKYV